MLEPVHALDKAGAELDGCWGMLERGLRNTRKRGARKLREIEGERQQGREGSRVGAVLGGSGRELPFARESIGGATLESMSLAPRSMS